MEAEARSVNMSTNIFYLALSATLVANGVNAAEKRVKMESLPPAVQKTVQEQSKGATIRGLSQEIEDGKTFYEAELKVNGHNKDVLIDPAGSVVEVEEEVALDSVPAAVKEAIQKHAAKGKIVIVESVSKKDTLVAYEAKIKASGKTSEVRVHPDGSPAKEP
jgi:predicted aspartyl protease